MLNVTGDERIIWLVIGLAAGSVVGVVFTRKKRGFGLIGNLAIGLTGALLGGFAFDLAGIDLGLGEATVQYGDLLAAVAGATAVTIGVLLFQRFRRSDKKD